MNCRWCEQLMGTAVGMDGVKEYRCWEPFCGGCMCKENKNFTGKIGQLMCSSDERDEKLLASIRRSFTDEQWDELLAEVVPA